MARMDDVTQYFNRFIELHTGRVKPEQKRETPKKKTNKKKKTPAEKLAEAARKGKKLEMDEYKAHIIEEREHTQVRAGQHHRCWDWNRRVWIEEANPGTE